MSIPYVHIYIDFNFQFWYSFSRWSLSLPPPLPSSLSFFLSPSLSFSYLSPSPPLSPFLSPLTRFLADFAFLFFWVKSMEEIENRISHFIKKNSLLRNDWSKYLRIFLLVRNLNVLKTFWLELFYFRSKSILLTLHSITCFKKHFLNLQIFSTWINSIAIWITSPSCCYVQQHRDKNDERNCNVMNKFYISK